MNQQRLPRWMRRALGGVFAAGMLLAGSLLAAGPARADVNNFTIRDYAIDYRLSRDADNRSRLETTETITAQFPDTNQNRGIERYLPTSYDGHPTDLTIQSVKRADGSPWPYTTITSGQYTVVRIGEKNRFVRGEQTYTITYTQRDVTKTLAGERRDEFYWDTNGTEWRVPIDRLSVAVTLDERLAAETTGQRACYRGSFRSTERCSLTDENGTFRTEVRALAKGHNVTLALGFKQGTFAAYQKSLSQQLVEWWLIAQLVLAAVMIGGIIWLSVRFHRRSYRLAELGTIVPEYIPPKQASVQVAARLLGSSRELTAQLIDLAVRHYIQIIELTPAKWYRAAEYSFEIIRPLDDLQPEEREVVQDVFRSTHVGTTVSTKELRRDSKLAGRLQDNPAKLKKLMRTQYGLRQKNPAQARQFTRIGWVCLAAAVLLLSPPLLVLAIVSLIMGRTLWVLSDTGLALLRYIKGVKLYISVAEAERLKLLQSPEGAQKTGLTRLDEGQIVKLYERLLPYAILFGQETAWNKQLGLHYEAAGAQPGWYTAAPGTVFNAAVFSGAMTQLTSSIGSSGASSSTSGGASGSGYSGGGGGGGGGGGW